MFCLSAPSNFLIHMFRNLDSTDLGSWDLSMKHGRRYSEVQIKVVCFESTIVCKLNVEMTIRNSVQAFLYFDVEMIRTRSIL